MTDLISKQDYTVRVPNGVYPGNQFPVSVGNETTLITCPHDCFPGEELHIQVIKTRVNASSIGINSNNDGTTTSSYSNTGFHSTCLFLQVILFILITLSYALGPYTIQNIGDACNLVNTKSNSIINSFGFYLYDGMGTSVKCRESKDSICIPWENTDFWNSFDISANSVRKTSYNTSYEIGVVQVIIPLASAFVLCSMLLQVFAIATFNKKKFKSYNLSMICIGWTLLLSFFLLLVAFNIVQASNISSATGWYQFFNDLLDGKSSSNGEPIKISSTPSNGCYIRISYSTGGSLLAAAMSINFFIALYVAIGNCIQSMRAKRFTQTNNEEFAYIPPVQPQVIILDQ